MRSLLMTSVLTLASTLILAAEPAKLETGKYNVDPAHSSVGFEIPHLVISMVEGKFKTFTGVLNVASPFTKSTLEAEADINSVDTSVADRDTHLKSPDFFDAAKFPKMTFKSTSITGNEKSFKLIGDLTIKGTTKKVTFDSVYKGSATDAYGNLKAAFVATTKISRKEFGLTWSKVVEVGPVVGDEVTITLKIQAAKEVAKK
ncbi:MAG: YceI family protein [Pseudobdellovibrio sp.]